MILRSGSFLFAEYHHGIGLREYTLNAEATGIVAEKEEAQYTYKGDKGYIPMVGFIYELGVCLYDEFVDLT